jgi:hypothetical protein
MSRAYLHEPVRTRGGRLAAGSVGARPGQPTATVLTSDGTGHGADAVGVGPVGVCVGARQALDVVSADMS